MLLQRVIVDDKVANNGEILLIFGLLITITGLVRRQWYNDKHENLLEDQKDTRQYRGKSSERIDPVTTCSFELNSNDGLVHRGIVSLKTTDSTGNTPIPHPF